MNLYFLIFYNSMQSNLFLTFRSDTAWLAALTFGGYNMILATALAFVASTIGMSLNFALGFYITRWRDELPSFNEEKYQWVVRLFKDKLFLVMILPPWPFLELLLGWFMPLLAIICGLFRVPPRQAIASIMLSRMLYYGYYLTQ
jgi:membrane protein YqaA with SNARE-associated domain